MGDYEASVAVLAEELSRVEQVFRKLTPQEFPTGPALHIATAWPGCLLGACDAIVPVLAETFASTIDECLSVPADTVGPGYFAPMRVDEFAASRIVEAVVHGLDLTIALGRIRSRQIGARRVGPCGPP